jgi:hypothetical protein
MDAVISKVADVVGAGLTGARARIAQGKAEVAKYVAQLPQDLQKVGKEAEEKLSGQFEQLTADVDSKQSELVDTLAHKYVEARDALDSRIDEMKAANRGLVDKALDAVVGVVKTILQLKNLLLGVLAKAADVIGDIITDPIGFLGKLIDGVKAGLSRFVGNIASHLKEGLMGWLFGALGSAGIELPKTFDFQGILGLVLQILGLPYRSIRARVVKLVGEKVVGRLERTVDVFKILVTEGVAGLWKWIKDKVGDLEDLVLGQIKTFIIEKVIKAGITWLIAFLNPAAAFIKACKAIYDIVMFLIERGSEIMDFVRSILDSVGAIAKGAIGIVAEKVESSLAKALPLAISFLASLLGLGGISEKIHGIIKKVQAPINKAVDVVVMGAVKGAKKLFGGALGWAKGKYEKGKKWVKGKVEAGKQWVKDKATAGTNWAKAKARQAKDRLTGGGEQTASASDDVQAEAASELKRRISGPLPSVDDLRTIVAGVLSDLRPKGLKTLQAEPNAAEPGKYNVMASASEKEKVGEVDVGGTDPELELLDDGTTPLDQRKKLRDDVRALLGNEETMTFIFDQLRAKRIGKANAVHMLRKLVSENLVGGYRIDAKEKDVAGFGRRLNMNYYGINSPKGAGFKVGIAQRAGEPVGWAYIKVGPPPSGGPPEKALALDFYVVDAIKDTKVKGVGGKMFELGAQHFGTEYQGVVGEWYTMSGYGNDKTGRPAMSDNLVKYIEGRRNGDSEQDAVKKTWTYKRVKELYGDVELEIDVQELVPDIYNPPKDAQIVAVRIKPR